MPADIDIAYLAGLIDGEGTICLYHYVGQSRGYKQSRLRPMLAVTNTHEGVLRWVHQSFGGRMHRVKRKRNEWRPCFVWETGHKHGALILRMCLPYLKIKRQQADLYLAYSDSCRHNVRRKGVSSDVVAYRSRLATKMSDLNKGRPNNAVVIA